MLDKNQVKQAGIRYARSLQTLVKTAIMFSHTHNAINLPLQHSFDQLNEIVKQLRQFTIGFVDQRVMINNILTSEPSLKALENEFLKRGIGAVTFEAGITMAAYRRVIAVMAAPVKAIEEQGGLNAFLLQNAVEFARIIPAAKNQQRTESGDTILETDSESYLMSKALSDLRTPGMEKVDWFLQSTGIGAVGGGESGFGDGAGVGQVGPGGGGSGFGRAGGSGSGGGGTGTGSGEADSYAQGSTGGAGGAGGSGSGSSSGGFAAAAAAPAISQGGPSGITGIVESFFNATLMEGRDSTQQSYVELARIISESRPEMVLASFPPKRREELRQLPPDQMAAEVIEDTAAQWAAKKLAAAPPGAEGVIVEEEVVRVLLRSLQATQVASRLAQKLADHIREFKVPQSTAERIRGELEWVVVPPREKTRRLLQFKHFELHQFRRLLAHIQELMKMGEFEVVTQLANHYASLVDASAEPTPEELSRLPELVHALAGLRSPFWADAASRLCKSLAGFSDKPLLHQQALNALLAIAHTVSKFEEFELVETIGTAIQGVATSNPGAHEKCCVPALEKLMSTHAVERVLELFFQKRDDGNWMRTAAALIRLSGQNAIGKVFLILEEEQNTANRLALIRLIGRLGPPALVEGRKCLHDERWYVVRNACKLLGQLKDPDLLAQLGPVLQHKDQRVQSAAFAAIKETRDPSRGAVLAESLAFLHPQLREEVLNELLYLRDPASVGPLERMIFNDPKGSVQLSCAQTLTAIQAPEAQKALYRILTSQKLEAAARRIALSALTRANRPEIDAALRNFAETAGTDPLGAETIQVLKALGR